MQQSGLMGKLLNEFKWEVERSSTGNLLQVDKYCMKYDQSSALFKKKMEICQENYLVMTLEKREFVFQASSGSPLREVVPLQRKLTLDDTQGMYLLLGAGYLIAIVALIGELVHSHLQKKKLRPSNSLVEASLSQFSVSNKSKNPDLPSKPEFFRAFHREEIYHKQTAYKEFEGKILASAISDTENTLQKSKGTPKVLKDCLDELFGEKNDYSVSDLRFTSDLAILSNNVKKFRGENVVFDSITSLPWEWGSESYYRRSCDYDRLHTN